MKLTQEQVAILRPGIMQVWNYIGDEVGEIGGVEENIEAIEITIDADRLRTHGFNEAQSLINQLFKDNSISDVIIELSRTFRLV